MAQRCYHGWKSCKFCGFPSQRGRRSGRCCTCGKRGLRFDVLGRCHRCKRRGTTAMTLWEFQ